MATRRSSIRKATGDAPAESINSASTNSSGGFLISRKFNSTGGESPTSAASPLPPSPPHHQKASSEQTGKLRKQRSSDRTHIAGVLWPSAKNSRPVAVISSLRDHLIEDNKVDEDWTSTTVPTHAASTFSSRRRVSSESIALDDNISSSGRSGRGRRSTENHNLRYHFGKYRASKKPGTPPSPSSSSSSGPLPAAERLSVDENALNRRRSEFDLDFPSMDSDCSETRNPSARISRTPIKIAKVRKSGSPVRRSKSPVVRNSRSPVLHNSRSQMLRSSRSPVLHKSRSPVLLQRPRSPVSMVVAAKPASGGRPQSPVKGRNGSGMGSIINLGIGNFFRRKSFSGTLRAAKESSSPAAAAAAITSSPAGGAISSIGSPSSGVVSSISSPARGAVAGIGSPARGFQAVAVAVDAQHKLKLTHNQLLQWRFLNGGTIAVNAHKSEVAEKEMESAWVGLSELQASVAEKKLQLAKQKLSFKLKSLIYPQIKRLERWGAMEKQHVAALTSTAESFHAVVCRLPLTDNSKADSQILSILLRQASNVAASINANIATCNSMAIRTVPLLAQLAQTVSVQKPLIEECYELLGMVANLQFQEESLRCQLIQLKS